MCGVGTHHQNGVGKEVIRTIVEHDIVMLLHARILWAKAMPQLIWPFSLACADHLHNHLHVDKNVTTPVDEHCGTKENLDAQNIHAFWISSLHSRPLSAVRRQHT